MGGTIREQRPVTAEVHSKVQDWIGDMCNSVKGIPVIIPSNPIEALQQASATEPHTVEETSSKQIVKRDEVESQVTPTRSSESVVRKRGKRRDIGFEATVVESPDWLPKGWITEMKFRECGSTAGTKDKYYFDPVSGHRFRSKPHVLRYLSTGEITRYKPKPKLLGTGNGESQPVALQSADASNLHNLDINSSSGVSNNLKCEPTFESDSTHMQQDEDTSTCPPTREASMLMSNGFKAEVSQQTEATKAEMQDVLCEENSKMQYANSECQKNMKRKQHPALDREKREEEKECSNNDLQHMSKILKLDGSANEVKRQKLNDHLTGATRLSMAANSNEISGGTVQRPCEENLAFPTPPATQGQSIYQEQNVCSLQNSVKRNGADDVIIIAGEQNSSPVKVVLVSNTGPEYAIPKPPEASKYAIKGQPSDPRLAPPIHGSNLNSNNYPPYPGILVANSVVNIGSCFASPGSPKVVPIPDPASPCSVLPHSLCSSLQENQPSKARKTTRKLKVSPQEMKKRLVALGRKLCRKVIKQNLQMAQKASPINLESHSE